MGDMVIVDILLVQFLNVASVSLVVGGWCDCGVPLLLVHILLIQFLYVASVRL